MPQLRLAIMGRAIAIFSIGLFLEYLGTNVLIILPLYAILYILVLPFLRLSVRLIVATSCAIALIGPTILTILRNLISFQSGAAYSLVFQPSYSLAAWLSLMLLGLALGRSIRDWLAAKTAFILLSIGSLISSAGYILSIFATIPNSLSSTKSNLGAPSLDSSSKFDAPTVGPTTLEGTDNAWPEHLASLQRVDWGQQILDATLNASPHQGSTAEIISSGGFAVAILGLCLIAVQVLKYLLYPFIALGAMPLTAYALHVIAIWFAVGPQGSIESTRFFWGLLGSLIIFACIWFLYFKHGPLEKLTIKLSYAMRKN